MDSHQNSLIDNFENAFMNCTCAFTKQESSVDVDKDEIKLEVEQTTMKFIELARQMETFFLQKRFLLSRSKPELLLKEENVDLRHEIARKDELIKKHIQKIAKWKTELADQANVGRPGGPPPPVGGIPQPGMSENPPPIMPGQRHPNPQGMMQPQQMMPNNPGMFMPGMMPRPGFPQGPMGVPGPGPMGGNPLAFLEKTTNNIDMGPSPR